MASQLPDYYNGEQPDDQRSLQSFHKHLAESLISAKSPASDQEQTFVPFQDLADYLTEDDRLDHLLWAIFPEDDQLPIEVSVVQEGYLKALCILLSIGKAKHIRHFCEHENLSDSHIPFHSKPPNFPINTTHPTIWDLFFEKQWMFCAAEMTFKIHNSVDAHRILPIIERKELARGGSAVVSKIVLHSSLNKLRREGSTDLTLAGRYKDTFVLKTYHEHDAATYYGSEVDAFRRLRPSAGAEDPNIIHFHGSYTHNGTYNVILDFADQGNLEQYFQNVLPPTSGRDIELFWASLCGILKALVHIHAVTLQNDLTGPQILQGWHQDVKPENILVKSNNCKSPYQWKFILSDLGLSHFKRTSTEGSDIDAYGTQTYGAPECYREDKFLEDSSLAVKQNVDIWSFGCILCEAAVWLTHGYPGLQKFRLSRKLAIAADVATKNGDWFHNGDGEILPVVLERIDSLNKDFRNSDHITGMILERLVKPMLDVPEGRPSAKQAYLFAGRIVKEASSAHATQNSPPISSGRVISPVLLLGSTNTIPSTDVLVQSTGTANLSSIQLPSSIMSVFTTQPPTDTTRNASSFNVPALGMPGTILPTQEVATSTPSANKVLLTTVPTATPIPTRIPRRPSLVPARTSPTRPPPELRVEDAERWMNDRKRGKVTELQNQDLLRRLVARDHVFLIDDAGTMKVHEPEVKRIIEVLAYFLKNADPDGMELYFTGTTKKYRSKDPQKLVEKFLGNDPKGITDIRIRLDSIINSYIEAFDKSWFKKKFKPIRSLTIYVLTDGIWQPSTDLSPLIKRLLAKLDEHGKFHAGIQFISFGSDNEALKRLDRIDDDLELNDDIVDHEVSTGNVWKMLFGSTDPWFDGSKKS